MACPKDTRTKGYQKENGVLAGPGRRFLFGAMDRLVASDR